jgi:hypothetical protein
MSLHVEFGASKSVNACIVNIILCTLYPMSKQNVKHICNSVCCHSQNYMWLTGLHSNRFCIFIGYTDKSHNAKYSIYMYMQCCCHEYCAYCAWVSLSCILNTAFSKQWLPTLCIHSFIRTLSTDILYVLLHFHYPWHSAAAVWSVLL